MTPSRFFVLALLLHIGACQTFAQDRAPSDIRVMAYNIKHGRGNDGRVDIDRIAEVIKRLQPDVVALQEVDNRASRSGRVDEAARLSKLTGLQHHALSIGTHHSKQSS